MKEFLITYQAKNIYPESVTEGVYDFMVLPCNDESQFLIDAQIDNSLGESVFNFRNMYGFDVTRLRTDKKFKELDFTVNIKVRKRNAIVNHNIYTASPDENLMLDNFEFKLDNHLYLSFSKFTQLNKETEQLLLVREPHMNISFYLDELMTYLNSIVHYEKNATDVYTTSNEVLLLKKGVCQDFTHVFITMCRYNNIPARYVSGYLYTNNANNHKEYMMHAWAEALIPGFGWVGYDASNKSKTDINYIKVAHGVDYTDCTPIKGILKTNSITHNTQHSVSVSMQ
jgi:hypothetical protein